MEHLGDDRLGRALDRLFDADRAALLIEVALAVGERFGVNFDECHNDSTSISFYGSYRSASGCTVRGRTAPAITYERFYPPGWTSAEARLRFYASQFPLVEVDSSFSARPSMLRFTIGRRS